MGMEKYSAADSDDSGGELLAGLSADYYSDLTSDLAPLDGRLIVLSLNSTSLLSEGLAVVLVLAVSAALAAWVGLLYWGIFGLLLNRRRSRKGGGYRHNGKRRRSFDEEGSSASQLFETVTRLLSEMEEEGLEDLDGQDRREDLKEDRMRF